MSFACYDVKVVIVKTSYAGIVPEHGNHPVLFLLDGKGGSFNTRLEEVVNSNGFTC